jgi:hypothetical protein
MSRLAPRPNASLAAASSASANEITTNAVPRHSAAPAEQHGDFQQRIDALADANYGRAQNLGIGGGYALGQMLGKHSVEDDSDRKDVGKGGGSSGCSAYNCSC